MAEQVGKKLKTVNDAQFEGYNDLISMGFTAPSKKSSEGFEKFGGRELDFDPSDYYRLLGTTVDPRGNLEEQAAQEQSVLEKTAKGIARIGTKIGFEVAKMPGELFGVADWAFTDKEFGEAVNNKWVETLSGWEEKVNEDVLKVYVPESVRTGNLWDNITSSSFWATEGADGVGFLLSMFLPGQFLKAAKGATEISAINELAKGLDLVAGNSKLSKLIKPGSKATTRLGGQVDDFVAATANTFFESASEGIETAKGVEDLFVKKRYDELIAQGISQEEAQNLAEEYRTSDEVKQAAGNAGAATFRKNLAILIGPNIVDQKWLFKGFTGARSAESAIQKRLAGQIGKTGDDLLKDVTRLTGKQLRSRAATKALIGVGKEGFFEEGLQFAASELDKNRAIDPDVAENILSVYFDNLSNTDMQKSIFLGAVLGGIMGGIGGFNQAKQEDRYLFGDEGKEPGKIGKFLGLRERPETRGVVDVFKDNFINRYQSTIDLFERDENNHIKLDDKNRPILDRNKVLKYGYDILKDQVKKEELEDFAKLGDKEAYEYIKAQRDLSYMMPFIREEGGYKLLTDHINNMAEKEFEAIQKTGLYEDMTVQEVKQDLLSKANKLNKIYKKAERGVPQLFKFKKEDTSEARVYQDHLFDAYITSEFMSQFLRDQNSRLSSDIAESYQGNIKTNDLSSNAQVKAGTILTVNGERMMVAKREKDNVTLRSFDGRTETKTLSELKEESVQVVSGISQINRADIKDKVEIVANNQIKLDEFEEGQERLTSRKDQQEGFDEYLKASKEAFKKSEKAVVKKTEEDVQQAKTAKEVKEVVEKQDTPEQQKAAEKQVKKEAKKERAEKNEPETVKEQPKSNPQEYYKDKTHVLVEDMESLMGKNAFADGLLLSAINETDIISGDFEIFKDIYHSATTIEEAQTLFFNFLEEFSQGKVIPNQTERDAIQSVLDKYFAEKAEEVKEAQETSEENEEGEEDLPELMIPPTNVEDVEAQSNENLDGKEDGGTGDIVVVSHDHLLRKKEDFGDKEQAWLLARDEDGNPILLGEESGMYIDKATHKELEKGRKLLNSGKIPVGTTIRFKVDRGTIYNKKDYNGNRRGEKDFQIQIVTEYKGKEVLLGYVPIYSKDRNDNTKELRNKIWNEQKNLGENDVHYSDLVSEVTKIKSGKILFSSNYRDFTDLSKNLGEFYLTAVVSTTTGIKSFRYNEEDVPREVADDIDKRTASVQDDGAIHVWVRHPGNNRWYPLRLFSKHLGEPGLESLKQTVKDQLAQITDLQSAKDILQQIKEEDAVIDFRYDEKTGIVTPRERDNGRWIARNGENGTFDLRFPLAEIATHENVDRWLNNVVSKVNKKHLNSETYNSDIANRLKGSFMDPIFMDINFEFAPPKVIGKTNESNQKEVSNEVKDNEEKKIVTPVKDETPEEAPESEEEQDSGDDLSIDLGEDDLGLDLNIVNTTEEVTGRQLWDIANKLFKLKLNPVDSEYMLTSKEITIYKENEDRVDQMVKHLINPPFRLAEEGVYKKWDKEQELAWFKERFPNIPITVLENIRETFSYSKEAWGVFRNAAVYIQENAAKGTAYHEAFHVVFRMYLNEEQRQELLKDNTEEELAIKFTDYVNGLNERTLGQKILDFFKGLLRYIQYVATGRINEDVLFRKIQGKKYTNKPFTKDVSEFQSDEYTRFSQVPTRLIKEWNRRELVLQARAINNFMLNKGLQTLRDAKPEYKDLDDLELLQAITLKDANGKVTKSGVFRMYGQVYQALAREKDNIKEEYKAKYLDLMKSLKSDLESGKPSPGSFMSIAIRDLNNYGIRVVNGSKASESEEVQDSVDDIGHQETWQIHQGGVNSKNLITYGVKKYIRGLVQLNKQGQEIGDIIGVFHAPVNYDTFYDTLMKDISGEESITNMIQVLKDLSIFHPEYIKIAKDLEANKQLATEFFTAFSKPEMLQVFVSELFKGKDKISDIVLSYSNRSGVKGELLNSWVAGVESTNLINEPKRAETLKDKVLSYEGKNFDRKTSAEFASLLSEAGISVPGEFMYGIYDPESPGLAKESVKQFAGILAVIAEGNNPFEGEKKESKFLDKLLNRISKTVVSLTQPSFNNAKNERVYSHLEGNYMVRFINKLKKDDKSLEETLNTLMKDEFYAKALPLFNELLKIKNKETLRENLEYAILDGTRYANESQGSMFTDMSPEKLNSTLLSLFANNGTEKKEAWYRMFTLSDAPIMPLIKYTRKGVDKDKRTSILDSLVIIARAEVFRINRIKARQDLDSNQKFTDDKGRLSYDAPENGTFEKGFKLLPFLNGKGLENMDLTDANSEDWAKVKKMIKDALDAEVEVYKGILVKQGIITKTKDGYAPVSGMFPGQYKKVNANIEEFIREFFYNDYFMRSQFSLVSIGDIAFYSAENVANGNPVINAQKRAKEIHSPRTLLDLTAVNPVTKEPIMQSYNGIILKDEKMYSRSAESIYKALIEVGETDETATKIAANYGYTNGKVKGKDVAYTQDKSTFFPTKTINQTDAQAYITLPFYRDTMIGAGRWNAKLENMYHRLMNGTATAEDIKEVIQPLQPFKPFAYGIRQVTQTRKLRDDESVQGSYINEDTGEVMIDETINLPTQLKNSEYVLIPQLVEQGDEKMKKLFKFMMDNNISTANFESAGKTGNYGVTKAEDVDENTIFHNYSMSFRGIQQEVPEHFLDSENLYGTQIRALIMSNLIEGADYTIGRDGSMNPITRKAKDLYDLYNELLVTNIEKSYEKLAKDFGINEEDPKKRLKKIKKLLIEEIQSRDKGEQYEKAIQIRKKSDGTWGFALPLFHPLHSKVVENLINSIFKNRITKQKINGGAFVQVSAFGYTDKLNLVFNQDGGLKHAEVMLPIWSRELFEPYMENGVVNMERLTREAPELLEGVGYRIPTEDKYSMLPIKVVGFLPLEAGGAIMLPSEITTIAGSDFDIDKMFVMMPEGKVRRVYKAVNENDITVDDILKDFTSVEEMFSEKDKERAKEIKEHCIGRSGRVVKTAK